MALVPNTACELDTLSLALVLTFCIVSVTMTSAAYVVFCVMTATEYGRPLSRVLVMVLAGTPTDSWNQYTQLSGTDVRRLVVVSYEVLKVLVTMVSNMRSEVFAVMDNADEPT